VQDLLAEKDHAANPTRFYKCLTFNNDQKTRLAKTPNNRKPNSQPAHCKSEKIS
jgi:hypothetical protein